MGDWGAEGSYLGATPISNSTRYIPCNFINLVDLFSMEFDFMTTKVIS
jgi:hypothetical protein